MEPQKPNGTERQERNSYALSLIHKMAAAAVVELPKESQAVYLEALAGISREALTMAVSRTIREWDKPHMMPPIAFILARLQENHAVLAEAAWETLQRIIYRDWHPDIGWTRDVKLDAAMEYAIRQCGGLHRIHDVPKDNFNFIRRDFIAAYQRYADEGGSQDRLSHKQATEILGQLERKQLAN